MARKPKEVKVVGVQRAKGGKLSTMKFDKKGWPELPFKMKDSSAFLNKAIVVLAHEANAWFGVTWGFESSAIVARVMKDADCGVEASAHKRFFWLSPAIELGSEPGTGVDHTNTYLQNYRKLALDEGATPEAIRLLHGYEPFTETEIDNMTTKLAKKGKADAAPKADKAAKTDKPKNKGNAEALAKARAAREEAGPDLRKLTILKKENPYREGSNRAASFDALKGAKTVEDYKTAGGKAKYIARWEGEGLISVK